MKTNISEVFNSVLQGDRYLPITACAQSIFYRVTKYQFEHRDQMAKWKENGMEFPKRVVE